MNSVQEIERAIDALTPQQADELYEWFDRRYSQRADAQLKSGLNARRFDDRINRALADHKAGNSGRPTGADLIQALQSSPCRELDIEPARLRLATPARDITF